jgi:hypothetical protein
VLASTSKRNKQSPAPGTTTYPVRESRRVSCAFRAPRYRQPRICPPPHRAKRHSESAGTRATRQNYQTVSAKPSSWRPRATPFVLHPTRRPPFRVFLNASKLIHWIDTAYEWYRCGEESRPRGMLYG